MSSQVELFAIISPKPGLIDKLIETVTPLNKYVEANEPDTLRYEMYRQVNVESGNEDLVLIELYKDEEALEKHRSSGPYKDLHEKAAKEQLLAKAPDLKVVKRVGGFALRGST